MLSRVEAEVETLPFHDRLEARRLLLEFKENLNHKALVEVLKILKRYGFKLRRDELKMLVEDVLTFIRARNASSK